jgi:LysR family glycine cleavage system transcriptional activator
LTDFAREDVDVAIRYGNGNWPGLSVERVLTEDVFPVCSPDLPGLESLRRPQDIADQTLLHDDLREDWRMWLLAAGVEGVDAEHGPSFADSAMVVQAAVEGLGLALARSALAAADLAAGRLVRPFDISLPTEFAYYIVCLPSHAERPAIKAFRQWLVDTVKAENEFPPVGVT